MKAIKHGNNYGLVLSKEELRCITVCIGMANSNSVSEKIRKDPEKYGPEPYSRGFFEDRALWAELHKALMSTDEEERL